MNNKAYVPDSSVCALVSATEESEQIDEDVDEVEIEREGADDGILC